MGRERERERLHIHCIPSNLFYGNVFWQPLSDGDEFKKGKKG